MLALKEKDLSSVPRGDVKHWPRQQVRVFPALGRLRQADPLGSLASLPSPVGNVQAMRDSVSKQTNQKGRGHRGATCEAVRHMYIQARPPKPAHACPHTHTNAKQEIVDS